MRVNIDRNNLICAAQTGDAKAINSLLVVCQADVRRYARKHCHISDIDDAVQESLLIVSKKIQHLKTILVTSHNNNTVPKTKLMGMETPYTIEQFIKDSRACHFYKTL